MAILGMGNVHLKIIKWCVFIIKNLLHVLRLSIILIFVGSIRTRGIKFDFGQEGCEVLKHHKLIIQRVHQGGLYKMETTKKNWKHHVACILEDDNDLYMTWKDNLTRGLSIFEFTMEHNIS